MHLLKADVREELIMGNLTAREKGFMYVVTLLIIVVLGYFFGIRTLNNKYDEYVAELNSLNERKAYLDQLKENNISMEKEIEALQKNCSELELSFIDKLETECIEQYVLKTFEEANCPFLISIGSTDVGMASVNYPDGTISPDGLACLQISVSYSSTDGFNVPQYNRNPDFTAKAEVPFATSVAELKDQLGKEEYSKRYGYDEFIAALKKINSDNPDCIKVDSFTVTDHNGVMTLNAAINFYATNLKNRISIDDRKDPYTFWCGDTGVDTKGGFIGFPYICDNEDSLWFGVVNFNLEDQAAKPFAAYWSELLFKETYENSGRDIRVVLGIENAETETTEEVEE